MKGILIFLLVYSTSCISQSKAETEQWLSFNLNKYFSTYVQYLGVNNAIRHSGNYYFDGQKLVHYVYITGYKNYKDSLRSKETLSIDLSKIEKITVSSKQDSTYGFYANIDLDFKFPDESGPSVTIYDNQTNKFITNGYQSALVIFGSDEAVLSNDLLNRMKKAFEHLVSLNGGKIIKDVF